ncbi:MAG: hypothetical protein ACOCW2_02190 [Chitinivibrionales bacterium]
MKQLMISIALILTLSVYASASLSRSVAILAPSEEQVADIHSAQQAMDVAGVPYVSCQSLAEALSYGIILSAPRLENSLFSSRQCDSIKEYTRNGGIFIGAYIREQDLFDLFGIESAVYDISRKNIRWTTSGDRPELQWINHPHEQTIRLAGPDQPRSVGTIAYRTESDVEVLATYEDGGNAVISRPYGQGHAYGLGYNLFSVIAKNLTNNDYDAELDYSNVFEPTTDMIMLLFRGIYQRHVPAAVWKHTCPGTGEAALMITHDVDSRTGVDTMGYFTAMEADRGIQTHYFVTTHYNHDGRMSDYYDADAVAACRLALRRNQHIGSHSVAHAPDMYKASFPIGSPGNTRETYSPLCPVDSTTGGSLYGETEVSKDVLESDLDISIQSFRSGHLCYPDALGDVLEDMGYRYNGTPSAANVLTNFPFFAKKDRSTAGALLTLLDIPMTISDVFMGGSFDRSNYRQRVDLWEEVTAANTANGAPTVLLIHPNRRLKVTAQEMFLDRLPSSVSIVPFDDFGSFWSRRHRLRYTTEYDGSQVVIRLQNAGSIDINNLSFVIDNLPHSDTYVVVGENNRTYETTSVSRNDHRVVALTGDTGIKTQYSSTSKSGISLQITPHLHARVGATHGSDFVYRIISMNGTVVHEQKGFARAGDFTCIAPKLANGMYMIHFRLGSRQVKRRVQLIR